MRAGRVGRAPSSVAARFVEIADRRRQPPRAQRRLEAAQPRERELDLHAALRPHQLVPFVDDDERRSPNISTRAFRA